MQYVPRGSAGDVNVFNLQSSNAYSRGGLNLSVLLLLLLPPAAAPPLLPPPLPLMSKHSRASSGNDIVPPPADAKDAHLWVAAHKQRPTAQGAERARRGDHPAARGLSEQYGTASSSIMLA